MINELDKEKDFFISYTGKDENWATWIAAILENEGYSTVIQKWDFKAGGSFVNDMNKASSTCKKIILVLSKAYMESDNCTAEWQSFFVDDPIGKQALIIPIRIEDVKPKGLLKARTYVDLYGLKKSEAKKRLIDCMKSEFPTRKSSGFPHTKVGFPIEFPFNNLPNRNNFFIGRDNVLKSIALSFKRKKKPFLAQAISGLGGIGKTQIAIEYAYRYAGQYDYIWLINAESEETLLSDLIKFVENKSTTSFETSTAENVIRFVRNWTNQNGKWLFIFDNAKDYSTISKYLPQNNHGQGNILITSRNEFWDIIGGEVYKLDIFNEEDALKFLKNRTKIKNDDENAKALNKLLGSLPLALEYAAAYITENDITFTKYIEMYHRYKMQLLGQGLTEKEENIAITWQVSINKISTEAAQQLLYICSYYASENINIDTLILCNEYLVEPLKSVVTDELNLNSNIHELRCYSLINITRRTLGVHMLLQESIRHSIEPSTEYFDCCFYHIKKLMEDIDYATKEGRDAARFILPHALSVFNFIESFEMQFDDIYNFCFYIAYGFYELAIYTESLRFFNEARVISENVLSKEHPDTARIYNRIALVYFSLRDYHQALEWNQKALDVFENVLGKNHPDTAGTYQNIANVYSSQGDYPQALELYQKALDIFENVLGKEHPNTAGTYHDIANVYASQGDDTQALEWYQKALNIFVKIPGKEHPDAAGTYSSIANIYDNQGEYSKALEWYQKALIIREKIFGKEHPDTAATYNNIANLYDNQGEYMKALEWYKKALEILEKVLGKGHPDLASNYCNIANVYDNLGEYSKALEWHQKALVINEKMLGKEHTDTAGTYSNIANVYASQGDYPKALEWNQKALVISEKVLDKEHPDIAGTYNNIANVYENQGEYSKALEWYQKALGIFEKVRGKEHSDTAGTYYNIANVYASQGEYSEALEWYQKALIIREKVLGKKHMDTAATYGNIANVYANQGEYSEALEWYQKALGIFEKVRGKEYPDTAVTYNNIANVYYLQGEYSKALEWYQKALGIFEKMLGKEHLDTASTYSDIANVYHLQGENSKALEWYQKALAIFVPKLGIDHPKTKNAKQNVDNVKG